LISDHPIPSDAGDFRLIDRSVVELLCKSRTPKPYLRGIIASYGLPSVGIPYSRNHRTAVKSKFTFIKVLRLGLNGVIKHSSLPLRFATFSGIVILFTCFLLSVYYIFLRLMNPELPKGLASIHLLVIFGIGMNALFLGIIGNYLNRIYLVLRNEPRYIIENSKNVSEKN
jgi:dolichol-phosphate mannosyltransferase